MEDKDLEARVANLEEHERYNFKIIICLLLAIAALALVVFTLDAKASVVNDCDKQHHKACAHMIEDAQKYTMSRIMYWRLGRDRRTYHVHAGNIADNFGEFTVGTIMAMDFSEADIWIDIEAIKKQKDADDTPEANGMVTFDGLGRFPHKRVVEIFAHEMAHAVYAIDHADEQAHVEVFRYALQSSSPTWGAEHPEETGAMKAIIGEYAAWSEAYALDVESATLEELRMPDAGVHQGASVGR